MELVCAVRDMAQLGRAGQLASAKPQFSKFVRNLFQFFFFEKIVLRHQFELITSVITKTYSNMSLQSWLRP